MRALRPAGDGAFARAGVAAYAVLLVLALRFHEPWRDEVQAWMLTADAGTPWRLFEMLGYEGHPALWYLVLWPVTRLTTELWALQAVHALVAVVAAYLLLAHAPFSRGRRLLLLVGYFFVYEWAVVARSYALGVLLVVLLLVTIRREKPRPVLVGVLLALLANTSAYGAIMAGGMALAWLIRHAGSVRSGAWRPGALGVGIAALGLVVAFWTARPPPDHGFRGNPTTGPRVSPAWAVSASVYPVVPAYAPVPLRPSASQGVWRVYWPETREPLALGAAAALGLVIFFGLGLASRPAAALCYLSTSVVLALFTLGVHAGGLRHYGYYFLALVAGVWLWKVLPEERWLVRALRLDRWSRLAERALPAAFTGVLVLQAVGGAAALSFDVARPYSGADLVVEHIEALGDRAPVAVTRAIHAPGPAARLGRAVYLLDQGVWSTWADRSLPVRPVETQADLLRGLEAVVAPGGSALVVSDRRLADLPDGWSANELLHVSDAIRPLERLRLSRVSRPAPP